MILLSEPRLPSGVGRQTPVLEVLGVKWGFFSLMAVVGVVGNERSTRSFSMGVGEVSNDCNKGAIGIEWMMMMMMIWFILLESYFYMDCCVLAPTVCKGMLIMDTEIGTLARCFFRHASYAS